MRRILGYSAILFLLVACSDMNSAPSDPPAPRVNVGGAAPAFKLSDQNGKSVSLSDYFGKYVVLEWTNPDCPFVQRHYQEKTMQTLESDYKPHDVVWLAINSTQTTTNDIDKKWATDQKLEYPVLNDSAGKVGESYQATNTPNMFIISMDGKVLYRGGIDNDPEGDKKADRVNYVRQALDQILAGKPVNDPETKPYGCGIKYKD